MPSGVPISTAQKFEIADLRIQGKSVPEISQETELEQPAIRRLFREDREYIRIQDSLVREISRSVTSGLIRSAKKAVTVLNEILDMPMDNPELYTKQGKPIGGHNPRLVEQKRQAAMGLLVFIKDLGQMDSEDYNEEEVQEAAREILNNMGLSSLADSPNSDIEAEIIEDSEDEVS